MPPPPARLAQHQHGKSRVRLGRTWRRPDGTHEFVEWEVATVLESDMAHAFTSASNAGMTATDTQKNIVYLVAKQCADPTPPDEYALRLARFLVDEYPLVSVAKVSVRASPWTRAVVGGAPHSHGFVGGGDGATPVRTAAAVARRGGPSTLTAGVDGWRLLKTTRSGYSGFLHDRHTLLPDTADRVAATSVTATWRYSGPAAYDAAYDAAVAAMAGAFFGPSATGVFSPSLQFTLRAMGEAVLAAVPAADSVHLRLPNLHFVPVSPPGSDAKFDNDVYVATSEPHGTIEATLTREGGLGGAHVRLWDEGGPASRL